MSTDTNLERLSPNDLVSGFARSPVVPFLFAAIAFHVVVIGISSIGYIQDRWIDPEGARQRREAQQAKVVPPPATAAAAAGTEKPLAGDGAEDGQPDGPPADGGGSPLAAAKPPEAGEPSAVEQRVTEKASDEELDALRLLGPETNVNRE
jgi:hypothetical protein